MKQNKKIITTIILICISTSFYSQIAIVKKAPDFKEIIRSIDTLALLKPYVDIKSVDVESNYMNDTVTSHKLSEDISNMISSLLKKKYSIKELSGNSILNNGVVEDFNIIFNNIDKSNNLSETIEFPDSIILAGNNTKRYCLISVINGYYPTREKVRKDTKKAVVAIVLVGVLSLGQLYMIPNTPENIILRFFLYDKVEKKVIFYKMSNLSKFLSSVYIHKVSYSELNQAIMTIYKPLYYK